MDSNPYHNHEDSFSETESSLSDALSPTDGYFSQSNQPRDFYVAVPNASSSSSSDASAKRAAEAQEGLTTPTSSTGSRMSYVAYASRPTTTTPLRHDRRWQGREHEPLLAGSDGPPPTYSAAVSISGQAHPQPTSSVYPKQTRAPFPGIGVATGPQSMGNPAYDWEETQGRSRNLYDKSKARFICTKANMTKVAVAVLAVLAFALLLTAKLKHSVAAKNPYSPPSYHEKPGDNFFSDWPDQCGRPTEARHETLRIDEQKHFRLTESIRATTDDEELANVNGKIQFLQGGSDQSESFVVQISMAASEPWYVKSLQCSQNMGDVSIEMPGLKRDDAVGNRICLRVHIDVFVAPGLSLETFDINSFLLPLNLEKLDTVVTNYTKITSNFGSLHAGLLDSRKTYIDLRFGSVYGDYALRDLLSIKTSAGSIDAVVHPKDADKDDPVPADLIINTQMGSAKIDTVLTDLPERDYRLRAETGTGSIYGTFVHGLKTTMVTRLGSMNIKLLPAANESAGETRLATESANGLTDITVLSPLYDPAPAIRSHHEAKLGSINLKYPQEWEGSIKAETMMGSVSLSGKDVKIIKKTATSVKAEKGDGDSSLLVETINGSVDLTVGDT